MTKVEAIEYGIQIMNIFPDDISVNDVRWVLKNLLESSEEIIAQQASGPDTEQVAGPR